MRHEIIDLLSVNTSEKEVWGILQKKEKKSRKPKKLLTKIRQSNVLLTSFVLAILISGLCVGFLLGLNYESIQYAFGRKTWRIITTFSLTIENRFSPTFSIPSNEWRVIWEATIPWDFHPLLGEVQMVIYNATDIIREISMRQFIWWEKTGQDFRVQGIYYFQGRADYLIELRGLIFTPIDFIIEAYF
ncbi:hypothetical protein J7K06_00850 [Candidatus Bathyarchaeota archaeon]|nr:hypothetical protein [Candidatus Bathyarchaeota archaeon]